MLNQSLVPPFHLVSRSVTKRSLQYPSIQMEECNSLLLLQFPLVVLYSAAYLTINIPDQCFIKDEKVNASQYLLNLDL